MDMIKEIINEINKKDSKNKLEKKKFTDRYWKMDATERIHYDSLRQNINSGVNNPINLIIEWYKLSLFLPAFVLGMGYIGGYYDIILPYARELMFSIFSFWWIIPISFGVFFYQKHGVKKLIQKLNKRFKLLK